MSAAFDEEFVKQIANKSNTCNSLIAMTNTLMIKMVRIVRGTKTILHYLKGVFSLASYNQ